jgi:uncharacterized protein YjbJ (UPF0337 family)
MSDEHIRGSVSQAQGVVEQVVGTLIRDTRMRKLGQARHAQGSAQKGLGNVQDALGGTRNGLNIAAVALAVVGALLLVAVMTIVGGARATGASRAIGEGI